MKRGRHYQFSRAVLATIVVVIGAVRFYQVRELLAAWLMFSVLFGAAGMVLLVLFLIQQVALKGVIFLETLATYVRAGHSGASCQPGKHHLLRSPRWN